MQENLYAFLIDDDPDDQDFFLMMMNEIDVPVACVFANDGVYALEKLDADRSFIPAVIFIDINMPRMNGLQCLAEIKKSGRLRDIPVYMYSTSAEQAIVDESNRLGATGFIKKEAHLDVLRMKLSEVLSSVRASSVK